MKETKKMTNMSCIREITVLLTVALGLLLMACPTESGGSSIVGSDNSETLDGTPGNDTIDGRGGNDTLNGLGGNDTLIGGSGADTLNGGEGNDWASYQTATAPVVVHLAMPTANMGDASGDSYSSIENLRGSPQADTLTGNSANNILEGLAGADTFRFDGAFGMDSIGSDGNSDIESEDTVEFTGMAELTFSYSNTDITIIQGSSRVTLYDANTVSGARLAGTRQESLVDFMLQQQSQQYNVIVGSSGADGPMINIEPSLTRVLMGGNEANLIFGLDGNDTIVGREESDILYGGAGSDIIQGDEGDDILVGGSGNDILYGGGDANDANSNGRSDNAQGSDTFVFESNFGADSIGNYFLPVIFRYGIDSSDTLQFNSTTPLTLVWSNSARAGDHDLTISQGSDRVIIYGASDATSDGGFAIEWNGMTEQIDSTTDTIVDGM